MKSAPVAFGLVIAVFLGGAVVNAQSLSDIAKKEEERRKAVKSSGKTYTNGDLKPSPQPAAGVPAQPAPDSDKPAAAAAPGEQQPPADAAKAPEAAKPEGEQKDEAYWKGLITAERTKLERNQGYLDALQSQVNALTNDFYARDDPAQRAVIWTRRTKALEEMDRLKKEVDDGSKAIAKIQDDARKAGVPPGWLR